MSFQAYLDTIKAKTGKTPDDFKALAAKRGLLGPDVKAGEVVAWLKEDFGLGHGHAMAIVAVLRQSSSPMRSVADRIGEHFKGDRERWRSPYDGLIGKLEQFGPGVSVAPTSSYLSVLKGKKKFALIQMTTDRMDIGIKVAGTEPTSRLEIAGTWNSMVTHRVRVTKASQLDAPLISWLHQAYERA
jgi:hypothetical protein